jgi:hypothetical protein
MKPWVLKDQESVRWLVEHPLPFFLCVVDKRNARLRVYHLSPRFYVWVLQQLPSSLELIPSSDHKGVGTQWQNETTYLLSAPILDATVTDFLDGDFHQTARKVLQFWVDVELLNIARVKSGIHLFCVPSNYITNSTKIGGWAIHQVNRAKDLAVATASVRQSLAYLASQLYNRGDLEGGAHCASLHRRLSTGPCDDLVVVDGAVHTAINNATGQHGDFVFQGVDRIIQIIDDGLRRSCKS